MAYDIDLSYPLGVAGVITQTYDEHTWGNKGTDFAVIGGGEGTQLLAASDGEVVKLGYDSDGYGHYVKLRIDPHHEILYAHMLRPTPLQVGDRVTRGRVVGLMGSTGRSTGFHLHLELRKDGKCINPVPYMRAFVSDNANETHTNGYTQVSTVGGWVGGPMLVLVDQLNVRSGPGTQFPVVGTLANGEGVTPSMIAIDTAWVQIGEGRWCALCYQGEQYLIPGKME
jgi:hypothetical protein